MNPSSRYHHSHQQNATPDTYIDTIPEIPDLVLSPESPLQFWWKKYLDSLNKTPRNPTRKHRGFTIQNGIIAVNTNYHVNGILPSRPSRGFNAHLTSSTPTTPNTPPSLSSASKHAYPSESPPNGTHSLNQHNSNVQSSQDERECWVVLKYFLQEYLKVDKKSCKGHSDIIVKTLCELYENEAASYIEALNDEQNLHEDKFLLPSSTPPQHTPSSSLGSNGAFLGDDTVSDTSSNADNFFQNVGDSSFSEHLGMMPVMIKCADWTHNRLLILQYGLFREFFEVIHSANDRIRHTKNITHILQIIKEIIVPHFVFLAKFLGVPIGSFKQFPTSEGGNGSGDLAYGAHSSASNHRGRGATSSPYTRRSDSLKSYPPNSFHPYDKMIVDHLDNAYKIAKLTLETLQVVSEILENNPSVTFLFALQELLLHSVRKILFVDRNEEFDKVTGVGGHKVLLYLLSWPLEHKQLVTSSDGKWQSIDFSLLDQKRMLRYYDLRMLTLQIICEGIVQNRQFLNELTDVGLFEIVAQFGLWLTYFFSFDSEEDHLVVLQTLKENVLALQQERKSSTDSDTTTPTTAAPADVLPASYSPPQTDTPAHSCNFTKKCANKKILCFFDIIHTLISRVDKLNLVSIQQIPTPLSPSSASSPQPIRSNPRSSVAVRGSAQISNPVDTERWKTNRSNLPVLLFDMMSDLNVGMENVYALEARKKLKLFSDFQFYFLDSIVSHSAKLPLLVANGLYDTFFSEYMYFYGGQSNIVNRAMDLDKRIEALLQGDELETPLTDTSSLSTLDYSQTQFRNTRINDSEKEALSEVTADTLRLSILQFVAFAATSERTGTSNKDTTVSNMVECRTLLSIFASNASNPFIVEEIGNTFIDILQHRYLISQTTLQDLRAFSIASFVLDEQCKLLRQLDPLLNNLDSPLIDGITNLQLQQHIVDARNTTLRLLTILLHFDTNHILVLDDLNTLNCLFSCLFDPKLREYGLQHLKKLTELRVENSAAFSSLVQAYMGTMHKIIQNPTSDSVHLLMMILKMLHDTLRDSPMLQTQFRAHFDDFVRLMSLSPDAIQNSGMSPKEFIWMLLRNLNFILSSRTHHFMELENKLKVTFPQMTRHLLSSSQHNSPTYGPSYQILKELLNLMVDGEFSVHNNYTICNAFVLPLMFEFSLHYEEKDFVSFVEDFTSIVEKSVRNRDMCCRVGLVQTLMDMIEDVAVKYDSMKSIPQVTDYVVRLLQILGRHSINVKELKSLFSLLKRQSEIATSTLLSLLFRSLQGMTSNTPRTYFNIDLVRSGLAFPSIDRFPSNNYAFSTWIRLHSQGEEFTPGANAEQGRQRYLLSFMNEKGRPTLEAFFQKSPNDNGLCLHLSTKKDTVFTEFRFSEDKWYHVAVVHTRKHFFASTEARLYVNGVQISRIIQKYPAQAQILSAHLGRKMAATSMNQFSPSSIATSKRNSIREVEHSTVLNGNIGAFYFFEDGLSPNQIQEIYALGPQYMSVFDPSDSTFFVGQKSSIFDGSVQNKVLFAVNARAQIGGIGLNIANPRTMPAVILEDTQLCASHNAKDIIGCLGGMKVLFPLFLRIDQLSHSDQSSDTLDPYLINSILVLTLDMLKNHKDNMDDMIRCKGFQVIGYLLKLISPQHRTAKTVEKILSIPSAISENPELMEQVAKYIILDFKIWIHTLQDVQLDLLSKIVDEGSAFLPYLRKVGIRTMMDMMRLFYWVDVEDISLGQGRICNPITHQVLGERPHSQGIVEIRQKVINLMRAVMQPSPTLEDIEVLVRFLADCNDVIQLRDILRFLLELMLYGESAPLCVEHAIQAGGFEIVCSLLGKQNDEIVELAVKCIGQMLLISSKIRQKYNMDQPYGFSYIRALISTSTYTERVYKALRNILFCQISLTDRDNDDSTDGRSPNMSADLCPVPCVIIALFELFQIASPDLLLGLLKDFRAKVDIPAVQHMILKQDRWQYFLFELMSKVTNGDDFERSELISIHKIIMDIFAKCLFHSLKYQKGGYRAVEETSAYLFFLAEEHKLSYRNIMNGIFERILEQFVTATSYGEMQSIRLHDTHIMDNFIHLTTLIEEHLFHTNTTTQSLFGRWRKKKKHFSLSLKVGTPTDDDDEHSIQSTQRKSSGGTPVVSVPAEDELHVDEHNAWKDAKIAHYVLTLMNTWDLLSIASFNSLNKFLSGSKNLRDGGTIRITLRLIKYLTTHTAHINPDHLKHLEQIVRRDIESEKEFQRFSELWAVTGDLKKTDDFHDRIMYILQFLCDAYDHMIELNNKDDATKVLNCIKTIFIVRRTMLEKKLRDHFDRPLLLNPQKFMFFSKKAVTVQDYECIRHGKVWKFIREKYFLESAKKSLKLEEGFTLLIVKKVKTTLNRVAKKGVSYDEAVEKLMNTHQDEIKRVSEPLKQRESTYIKNEKTRYEEQEKLDAILFKDIMRDVSNERGAWGNHTISEDDIKWMLDKTENKHRMRLKLKRDYRDINHEGAAMSNYDPDKEGSPGSPQSKSHHMLARKEMLTRTKSTRNDLTLIPRLAIRKDQVLDDTATESSQQGEEDDTEKVDGQGGNDLEEIALDVSASGVVQQEKTVVKTYCEVLTPMQGYSGSIEITTKRIIITVDKENKCEQSSDALKTKHLQKPPSDKVYAIEQIKEIHLRRYQLLNSSIEIFFLNQKNILLNFKKDERNKIYKKLIAVKPPNLIQVHKIRSPEENIARSGLTRLWQKRLISNFDYLMELNTFANRTYNDLSQYPVFPWVLVDYDSEKIDLNDPSVYRDLSKPIGALNESRLEEIDSRYDMFDDPIIPKFHYGSHYSSPGIVLYFLVRMEPFTTYLRVLQGGKFDHADRMFDSIPQTWRNTQTSSDFKELIPEFYYNPEFLTMTNRVHLGYKANGRRLGDALLPPWASSAVEFVRINRRALESEYVSQHLHEWVDLIFGFKQKGSEAVKAKNVYYYLTYEGKVDIEKIEDENVRRSFISQIQNFGQTPSQLFKKPHPARENADPPPYPLKLNFEAKKDFKNTSPIVYVQAIPAAEKIICITQDGQIFMPKFSLVAPQSVLGDFRKGSIEFPFAHDIVVNGSCFAYSSLLKDSMFSCGHWDFSMRCTRPFAAQNTSTLVGQWRQRDVVTCVTLSENDEYLVAGSRDTTIMVWSIDKSGNIPYQPDNILYGHDDEITCLSVSADLDVVVSGSKDGTIMIHTLRSGKYTRTIHHPKGLTITNLALCQETGYIVMYSSGDNMLYLYSINGKLLKTSSAASETQPRSSNQSPVHQLVIQDGRLFHDGHSDRIYCRQLENLSVLEVVNTHSQSSIRSLSISDGYAFVGLTSGHLMVLSRMIFKK